MDRESNANRKSMKDVSFTKRYLKIPDYIFEAYKERKENGQAGAVYMQLANDLVNNGGFNED